MMASPPVISAPTLVTSTNPVTSSPQNSLRDTNNADDNWHFKYLEAKGNYRKLKAQFREQANKSRQLIVVVKHKLQEEENEKIKLKSYYDQELSGLSQQILSLQSSMLRERKRVEGLLRQKDDIIQQQKQELEKYSNPSLAPKAVSVTSLTGLSPVALGGSLRIHGSFRQYKKDREKFRQHLKSDSSGISINSSEESSSSPSTLPRTNLHQKVRHTVSEETPTTASTTSLKTKGILKASVSVDSSPPPVSDVLTNLEQLIGPQKNSTKIQINADQADKSDSGRESDDIEQVPNVSVVTVSTSDSANSSFDASDPTLSWKINVTSTPTNNENVKKAKPPPPPRSSQTRLSTIRPKSILSPTSSLNTEMSPTEALDQLIRNGDNNKLRQSEKKKRVKFNPRVDTSTGNPADKVPSNTKADITKTTVPLDPNFLHFLPRLNQKQQEIVKKAEIFDHVNNNKSRNFSYYEPYI